MLTVVANYSQLFDFRAINGLKLLEACPFPKRMIPVQFGVGSPSLNVFDLSTCLTLGYRKLIRFTKIIRGKLGEGPFHPLWLRTNQTWLILPCWGERPRKLFYKNIIQNVRGEYGSEKNQHV